MTAAPSATRLSTVKALSFSQLISAMKELTFKTPSLLVVTLIKVIVSLSLLHWFSSSFFWISGDSGFTAYIPLEQYRFQELQAIFRLITAAAAIILVCGLLHLLHTLVFNASTRSLQSGASTADSQAWKWKGIFWNTIGGQWFSWMLTIATPLLILGTIFWVKSTQCPVPNITAISLTSFSFYLYNSLSTMIVIMLLASTGLGWPLQYMKVLIGLQPPCVKPAKTSWTLTRNTLSSQGLLYLLLGVLTALSGVLISSVTSSQYETYILTVPVALLTYIRYTSILAVYLKAEV